MKQSLIPTIFWLLVGVFVLVLCQFFIPAIRDIFKGSLWFLLPLAVFFLLGLLLLVLTLKSKIGGRLKKFLLITGASAAGFFLSVLLHNFFYALGVIASQIAVLNYLMKALHVVFFYIAIFVCPIVFLVGMIGSIVLLVKKGR
ncbi:hypothetical protein ES703_44339 [subsurface metagenome]